MNEKFEIRNREDYEMWTTTSDEGKTFGRLELEFKRPVSIVLGNNDEVIFHHCKHISSDKLRRNLSFYDMDGQEIVGSRMYLDVDYITEGGVRKELHLKDFRFKETLKTFFEGEFGECDLSESELMDFCVYYDVEFFDSVGEMRDELQSRQALTRYDMDFIDVDALAEDLDYTKINDDLWIDNVSFSFFQKMLCDEFEKDISLAIENWKN